MSETKTVKTALGELSFDKKNNHYTMTSSQLYKELEDAGLPNAKEVIQATIKARDKVLQKMAHFASDEAKKTMADTTISAGMMPYRLEAGCTIAKEVNVPGRDGAPTTRKTLYGPVFAKEATKTPTFIKDDDYVKQNAADIEKEYKAGNKIKIA